MNKRPKRAAGFTLVELLVVLAILALLLSILLPSLNRARQVARKTVCASNIRHLALANHLYAEVSDDYCILAAEDLWYPNLKRWHGERDTVNEAFDPQRGPMRSQMGAEGLKECPSFRKEIEFSDKAGQAAAFEAGCGGYGYNASYVGGRNDLYGVSPKAAAESAQLDDIACPAETVMFTDAAYVSLVNGGRWKIAYSFCEPPLWQLMAGPPSTMHPDPSIDFRHLGDANVAWSDGHATPHALRFTVSYQTHSLITGDEAARHGVGWFGPEDNSLFDLK